MDSIDVKLLTQLQRDSQTSVSDLAHLVGLSAAGVHKRLKKLHVYGYVKKHVALLDRGKLDLDLLCYLNIRFKTNLNRENLDQLEQALRDLPEVIEAYTLTGGVDAVVKIIVQNHQELKELLKKLAERQDCIGNIQTSIALEEIKATTELPIHGDKVQL